VTAFGSPWAARVAAPGRGLRLVGLSVAAMLMGSLVVTAALLVPFGVGVYLFPPAAAALRDLANQARDRAGDWSGVPVPAPRSWPVVDPDFRGRARFCRTILTDSMFWRELVWANIDDFIGAWLAALPAALILYGAFGAVMSFAWRPLHDVFGVHWYYTFLYVDSPTTGTLAALLGAAIAALGIWSGPWWLGGHAWLTSLLLAPGRSELARRVERLTDTRAAVADSSAAEIRRIERDLHDGAQARLVAMGMALDNAERLMERDPAASRALLVEARQASSKALQELRELVRGIHPPVLADRGVPDAVRALALDGPLDVTVDAYLPGRLAPPVESAVYFAISELLANAGKHAGATQIAVDLRHQDGLLRVHVSDNGRGGADAALGTGLDGIGRRLAAFDGTMTVDSPPGGPTTVRMEIPCVSSSPKTSSS
jgi:signal transduction histidine kinase